MSMANRKTAKPNNYGSASLLRYVERSIGWGRDRDGVGVGAVYVPGPIPDFESL